MAATTPAGASQVPEKIVTDTNTAPSDRLTEPGDSTHTDQLQQLRRQLRQNPRSPELRNRLRTTMQDYGERIRQAVRNGQYDQAEAYVKELLTIAPNNQKLRRSLREIREMSRRRRM